MINRILLILKIKNLTPSKFADDIGIQRSSMSHIMSGRNQPSLDLVTKILNKYKDINPEWLIFGNGSMYKMAQTNLFEEQNIKSKPADTTLNNKADLFSEINNIPSSIIGSEASKTHKQEETEANKENIGSVNNTKDDKEGIQNISQQVEKIVVFYKNKTFREYYPS